MTARMQSKTVKQMAQEAGVSERLIAQCLRVKRNGFDGLLNLVHPPYSASLAELLLVADNLLEESQRAWAAMPPDKFHRAVKNLRRELEKTALVQPVTSEVDRLRARVKDLETKLRILRKHFGTGCLDGAR